MSWKVFFKPQTLLRLTALHLHLEQIPHLQIHSIYSSFVNSVFFWSQNSILGTELAIITTTTRYMDNIKIIKYLNVY